MDPIGVVVYQPPNKHAPFLVVTFEANGSISVDTSSSAIGACGVADAASTRFSVSPSPEPKDLPSPPHCGRKF